MFLVHSYENFHHQGAFIRLFFCSSYRFLVVVFGKTDGTKLGTHVTQPNYWTAQNSTRSSHPPLVLPSQRQFSSPQSAPIIFSFLLGDDLVYRDPMVHLTLVVVMWLLLYAFGLSKRLFRLWGSSVVLSFSSTFLLRYIFAFEPR